MTESMIKNTKIEVGVIVAVDTEECVCTVRTETSEIFHENIPTATPGIHQESGTGLSYFPQGGETVLILTTGDGKRFILAYIPTMDDGGSFDAGRINNNPGDWKITGADGNFLDILRGGIVRLGSSNVCQTIYIPTRSLIHQISENLIIDTFAGSLEFNVARPEDNSDSKRSCTFNLKVQEFSDDKTPCVELLAGSGLNLKIRNDGNQTFELNIAKTGELVLSTKSTYSIQADGKLSLKTKNDLELSGANIKNTANTNYSIGATKIEMKAGNIALTGDVTVKGTMKVGTFPALTASPDMLTWLAKVSAFTQSTPPAKSPSTVLFG